MKISVIDGSNYFKGLLLLMRKDRKIARPEIEVMKRIGKKLGFDSEFCDNAIHEILDNEYIIDEPPAFSSRELAVRFIKDGLVLVFADNESHPSEVEWLRRTAENHSLDATWFRHETENAANTKQPPTHMQVDDLIVG
jgi:hypothetical protein